MGFERYSKPLASKAIYRKRVLRYAGFAAELLGISLGFGVIGYHFINGLGWIDSILNASMILTGMGPVDPMQNDAAKLFASVYSIFSGVAFLSIVAVFLSPVVHRFLHRHHLADDENDADDKQAKKKKA